MPLAWQLVLVVRRQERAHCAMSAASPPNGNKQADGAMSKQLKTLSQRNIKTISDDSLEHQSVGRGRQIQLGARLNLLCVGVGGDAAGRQEGEA